MDGGILQIILQESGHHVENVISFYRDTMLSPLILLNMMLSVQQDNLGEMLQPGPAKIILFKKINISKTFYNRTLTF